MFRHRNRHDPDRPRARNQHVFAQQRERQRRVHGIAKRIEDRRNLLVDLRIMPPDVRHRQRDKLRKRSRPIHPDAQRMRAQMPPPRQTVPAPPAGHMALAAHNVARIKIIHIRSHRHNLADKLMPNRHRHRNGLLRPLVPLVDMHIGPTDPRIPHANQHIVDPDLRLRNILQPKPLLRATLYQCLHPENVRLPCSSAWPLTNSPRDVHDIVRPCEIPAIAPIRSIAYTGTHAESGRIAQLVRAPALQAGCRGFESLSAHHLLRNAKERA